jgi:hypothetical protein
VLANIPRDYKEPCPLQDALGPEMPIASTGKLDLYAGDKIKAFDMEKLAYFAVSVFWRGAIHKWKSTLGKIPPPVDLGAYEEPIRKFLLRESFPDDVVLVVSIYRWKPALNALCPVIPDHLPECQRYWFYIPGMGFRLYLGKNIPDKIKERCAYRKKIICVDAEFSDVIRIYFKQELENSDQSKIDPALKRLRP